HKPPSERYTLSLPDALPIYCRGHRHARRRPVLRRRTLGHVHVDVALVEDGRLDAEIDGAASDVGRGGGDRLLHHVAQIAGDRHQDRKSTRLNSSHVKTSYAV